MSTLTTSLLPCYLAPQPGDPVVDRNGVQDVVFFVSLFYPNGERWAVVTVKTHRTIIVDSIAKRALVGPTTWHEVP